ncbi:MAG: LysM peptidoglycan-binding domain-containing protein [Verrucomicrobia bacterium]|nr:LysM peptidoglycan-binding domain-containing protein [Verrucomicrobiota bacterium]
MDLRLNSPMRGRTILIVSIGLNLVLAAAWYFTGKSPAPKTAPLPAARTNIVGSRTRFVPVIRKQFFSWSELESTDYDTYVANLRAIGCPSPTIRDIILADVNKLYDERRDAEAQTPEHFKALDNERRALLTHLLGANWDTSERQTGFAFSRVAFSDPLLNELPAETRARVQEILTRWSQQAVADPRAAAQLEQRMRQELAGVLSPAQLEELLSRYSANAASLNNRLADLKFFKATPQEFRALFRATDNFDLQLRLLGDADDPATLAQRQALEQQRETAVQNALGAKRYAEYTRLQDPAFRDAVESVFAAGGSADTVSALYAVNQEVALQQAIIAANTNLTALQRQIELKKIELAALQAQAQATGQLPIELPPVPQPTVTTQPHVIQPGENLGILARTFSTKIGDIMAVNPGVDFHALKPGDTINLPVIQPPLPPTPGQ